MPHTLCYLKGPAYEATAAISAAASAVWAAHEVKCSRFLSLGFRVVNSATRFDALGVDMQHKDIQDLWPLQKTADRDFCDTCYGSIEAQRLWRCGFRIFLKMIGRSWKCFLKEAYHLKVCIYEL